MEHGLYAVTGFKITGLYRLKLWFDDGVTQEVDLNGVLEGELYGPLRDPKVFGQVKLDHEAGNLVWPNGADFDPEILHDWPKRKVAMVAAAAEWKRYSPSKEKGS